MTNSPLKRHPLRSASTFRNMSRRGRIGLVAGLGVLIAGCAQDAPQDTWDPAGPNAQDIHNLQWPVFAIAGVVGVIVLTFVAIIIVKFRDRGQAIPEQTHGKPALEIGLTILPAGVLTYQKLTLGLIVVTVDTEMIQICNRHFLVAGAAY